MVQNFVVKTPKGNLVSLPGNIINSKEYKKHQEDYLTLIDMGKSGDAANLLKSWGLEGAPTIARISEEVKKSGWYEKNREKVEQLVKDGDIEKLTDFVWEGMHSLSEERSNNSIVDNSKKSFEKAIEKFIEEEKDPETRKALEKDWQRINNHRKE